MWRLTGELPATAKSKIGAPIARLKPERSGMAMIARITNELPPEVTGIELGESVALIPVPDGNSYTVDLSTLEEDYSVIDEVIVEGQSYTPASDFTNPQPGEFTHDPYTKVLGWIATRAAKPGMGFKIKGKKRNSVVIKTDIVKPPYPSWLFLVPATGELTWNRSFEGHPTGNLTLECDHRYAAAIRAAFQIGTELPLYDMMMRVSSVDEDLLPRSDFPEGRHVFSVSLEGKWQYYASQLAFYRDRPKFVSRSIVDGDDEPDPDCLVDSRKIVSSGGIGELSLLPAGVARNTLWTTVQRLAEQVGAKINAPEMRVYFTRDQPRSATVNWLTEAQNRVRQHGSYVYLSGADAVEFRTMDTGHTWRYGEEDIAGIKHTYQGGDRPPRQYNFRNLLPPKPRADLFGSITPSPPTFSLQPEDTSVLPRAEYRAVELQGKFLDIYTRNESEEDTRTQGQAVSEPHWRRVPVVRREITNGDNEPLVPPKGLKYIKTMDLVHTQSGPSKQVETTITEDGVPIKIIRKKYGASYHGFNVVNADGILLAEAKDYWKLVTYHITQYIYDSLTGYYLRSKNLGWTELQLQSESTESPETLELYGSDDPIDLQFLQLYLLTKVSIRGGYQARLKSYRRFYPESTLEAPPYEEYKQCLPNGTSRVAYALDPNWVEPMFVLEDLEETDSFYWRHNPDIYDDNGNRLPPYTAGEESSTRKRLKIIPANTANGNNLIGVSADYDRFLQFEWQNSATGNQFREIAVSGTFSENEGRPPAATRKPTNYEKVEPEKPNEKNILQLTTGTAPRKYILTTGDYSYTSPSYGSVSYSNAITRAQAITAAETDLLLKDMRESVQTSCTVPFNGKMAEGDFLEFYANGTLYKRRVLSVAQRLAFSGELNGDPIVVSPGTQIGCGIRRSLDEFNMQLHTVILPRPPKSPTDDDENEAATTPGIPDSGVLELGFINENVQTRRNFIMMNPPNPEVDPGTDTGNPIGD
ncbi:MAG TPA: hypothetical protein V6C65_04440 [Allocoleopsis sp.]